MANTKLDRNKRAVLDAITRLHNTKQPQEVYLPNKATGTIAEKFFQGLESEAEAEKNWRVAYLLSITRYKRDVFMDNKVRLTFALRENEWIFEN